MPPLASVLVDTQAVALVTAWIQSLAGYQDYNSWSTVELGSIQPKDSDFDVDGLNNYGEYLLQLDPDDPAQTWALQNPTFSNGQISVHVMNPAGLNVQVEWKSSLTNSQPWQLLQSNSNNLSFPASNQMKELMDASGDNHRIYRARLTAP